MTQLQKKLKYIKHDRKTNIRYDSKTKYDVSNFLTLDCAPNRKPKKCNSFFYLLLPTFQSDNQICQLSKLTSKYF